MTSDKQSKLKEYTFYVKGTHCPSCEILIEKRLLEEKGVEAVEVSADKGEVRVVYSGVKPKVKSLNKIFQKNNYVFSKKQPQTKKGTPFFQLDKNGQLAINKAKLKNLFSITTISLVLITGFIALNRSGLVALISVNSRSALPAFLVFGLMAGFSTCSALVGGIILSMSKQWSELYRADSSTFVEKFQPHLLFNAGRVFFYALMGGVLGSLGSVLQMSTVFTGVLTGMVSIIMVFLALQMLGL
ncbi:sulfite exporter TauE/SafE family protein, partial [Patescibacteria group bacterium]|nr:sulfite exporter TauE/SafE family protein [Patescibacteria group bacterium]